jgi:hypothetical protein
MTWHHEVAFIRRQPPRESRLGTEIPYSTPAFWVLIVTDTLIWNGSVRQLNSQVIRFDVCWDRSRCRLIRVLVSLLVKTGHGSRIRSLGWWMPRQSQIGTHATPLESIQFKVCAPSNYPVSSQAGSSPSQVPEDDECIAGGTRVAAGSGSTGYVCDVSHPSSNLSRNLLLCGGFLLSTESAGSMAQRDNRHSGSWLDSPGLAALQAVVR